MFGPSHLVWDPLIMGFTLANKELLIMDENGLRTDYKMSDCIYFISLTITPSMNCSHSFLLHSDFIPRCTPEVGPEPLNPKRRNQNLIFLHYEYSWAPCLADRSSLIKETFPSALGLNFRFNVLIYAAMQIGSVWFWNHFKKMVPTRNRTDGSRYNYPKQSFPAFTNIMMK